MTVKPDLDAYVLAGDQRRGELILEPSDGADPAELIGGSLVPAAPRVYRKVSGRHEFDFLVASDLTILASDRAVAAMAAHRLEGWRTFPVAVPSDCTTTYKGLAVTGRCELDHGQSRLEMTVDRGLGSFPVWKGLYPKAEGWGRFDFALVPGTLIVMVTGRVKSLADAEGWTNVSLIPARDAENYLRARFD